MAELRKFKRTQEVCINFVEESYSEKLQEIRELRTKLNADLDDLEATTLIELDEIRTTLQTPLRKDIDNCSRLKDELQNLSEAVHGLGDKSQIYIEFIASRKCLDKIHESESYLKEITIKIQSPIIFKGNIEIEQYLSKQYSLISIAHSVQSLPLKMDPDHVLNVETKSAYNVNISGDTSRTCFVMGMCSLPSGKVIVADYNNKSVKLLEEHFNVSSNCMLNSPPLDICHINSSDVAVTLGRSGVQFVYVRNGQLVKRRTLQVPHAAGIAHHQGALYITSGTALYHYTLTGSLVKKLYEDTGSSVFRCAVSPAGDRIYVTNYDQHKLRILTTDGSLISTFTDPELQNPFDVHISPAFQVTVCGYSSHTVLQVDPEGRKKLATLASQKGGVSKPVCVCCNNNMHQIIVGLFDSNNIIVMKLK
ncbi:uncharacterized protein LOC127867386 isoform X2 [Dreissena polymorpha]|uniref:uncharacterized protein LOC127867386 isoform X2 n=1 Tax=Dreissena polymorpha TaxID=45954 RepID=UPI00226441BD|nr:uncharacterized protein LOC127867386 isoform X2 [Dreissena polymorpha]